jgi:hypothetical protein
MPGRVKRWKGGGRIPFIPLVHRQIGKPTDDFFNTAMSQTSQFSQKTKPTRLERSTKLHPQHPTHKLDAAAASILGHHKWDYEEHSEAGSCSRQTIQRSPLHDLEIQKDSDSYEVGLCKLGTEQEKITTPRSGCRN